VLPDENKVVRKIAGPGSVVRTIFATNNEIWVGYENHGARLYDLSGTMKIHYTYPSVPKYEIKNASIRKIWRDTRGRLWIGSYKGLFLSIGSELIRFDREVFPGLPNSSIQSLYEDNQGGIWIGTWAGGVAYFHHAGNKFINYRHSKSRTSLTNNMVNSFAQTPDGDLFVGTERTGLNKFILKTNSFKNIQVLKEDELLNIRVLNVDKRGGLWIGSAFNGLFYKPPGKTEFIHFIGPDLFSLCVRFRNVDWTELKWFKLL
jgi:ligand-binding sensor domain-containing protein